MSSLRLEIRAVSAAWEQMDNVSLSIREIIDIHIPVEARSLNVDDQSVADMCSGAWGYQRKAWPGRWHMFYRWL